VIDEAITALREEKTPHLFALGEEVLAESQTATDDASRLGLLLLRMAGSEKAVALAFGSLTAERGWTVEAAVDATAEFGRLPLEKTMDVLERVLQVAPAASPTSAAAAAALAESGDPAGVEVLLRWGRSLEGPDAVRFAVSAFERITSTRAIAEFRKTIGTQPFRDEGVSRRLHSILGELQPELVRQGVRP
jgi:hypothetical protein